MEALEPTLRLIAASYLLLVAVLACFNMHQAMLAYPARVFYSAVRMLVIGVTFGRVQITPLAKRAKRRQARRLRHWRFALEEWRERREEEKALDRGERLEGRGGWTAAPVISGPPSGPAAEPQRAAGEPAAPRPKTEPVPAPPPTPAPRPDQEEEGLPELPDFNSRPPRPPHFD
jgi:hypothetical protein